MKRATTLMLALILGLGVALPVSAHQGHDHPASPAPAPSEVKVAINGQLLLLESPVYLVNGRTLLPFRAIFEALGAKVSWNADAWTITAISAAGDRTIQLAINEPRATVAGEERTLDVPPQLYGSRTYVPLRFVAEALGAKVEWDADWQLVRISAEQTYPAAGVTYPIFMGDYGQAWLAVYPPRPTTDKSHGWPDEFPVQTAFDHNRYQAAWGVFYSPFSIGGFVIANAAALPFHPHWFLATKGYHLGLATVEATPAYMTVTSTAATAIPLPNDITPEVPEAFRFALQVEPLNGGIKLRYRVSGGGLSNLDSRGQAFDLAAAVVYHPQTGAAVNAKFVHAGWAAEVPYIENHAYEVALTTRRRWPPVRVLQLQDGGYVFQQSTFLERDGLR